MSCTGLGSPRGESDDPSVLYEEPRKGGDDVYKYIELPVEGKTKEGTQSCCHRVQDTELSCTE